MDRYDTNHLSMLSNSMPPDTLNFLKMYLKMLNIVNWTKKVIDTLQTMLTISYNSHKLPKRSQNMLFRYPFLC